MDAYALADFMAFYGKINLEPYKKELAAYAMMKYVAGNSFQLEVKPINGTTWDANNQKAIGTVFKTALPAAESTAALAASSQSVVWNLNSPWASDLSTDQVSFDNPMSLQTVATVDIDKQSFVSHRPGNDYVLSAWVNTPGDMKRYGWVNLQYQPTSTPSTPITSPNTPPILNNQSVDAIRAETTRIYPSFTDDGNTSSATVEITKYPLCGTVSSSLGIAYYIPNNDNCTVDSFEWVVRDDKYVASNVATVTIRIPAPAPSPNPTPPANTPPSVLPVSVNVEKGQSVTLYLQGSDAETPANQLIFTPASPLHGTLKPTGRTAEYIYTHTGSDMAGEVISYEVSDGSSRTTSTLNITILPPVDHLPYARGQTISVVAGKQISIKLDGGDTDVADQPNLTWKILTPPNKGTATLNGSTLIYTHTAQDTASDLIQWEVRDSVHNTVAKANVVISVQNRPPIIAGITNLSAVSGTPISVNLSAVDPESGVITWQLASGSPGQINGATWTHTFNQSGTYPIKVIAKDPYTTLANSPNRTFTVVVDGACNFTDVPSSATFHTTVCAAVGKGWIVGYTENGQLVFKPNQTITRAEFAKLVGKYLEETNGTNLSTLLGGSPFSDVPTTHNMYPAVQPMKSLGILNGYSDGTFKPNQTITRAEMAVAIHRIGGWGRSGADTVFSDVPFSAPSSYLGNDWMNVYFAVGQLANNGILASDTPCANDPTTKCFRPNDSLTRLETLWILERLPQAIAEGQVKVAQTNANTPTNPVPQPNRVTGALNDTGITFCGDSDSTNSTDPAVCAAADSGAYPRQDLRYGRDAQAAAGTLVKVGGGGAGFDFTKIANNGSVLPASATLGTAPTDWACTKDNVTGLIWEVKTTSGLRSQNHTYTWYNSNPATNGGSVGTASGGYCETSGRCDTEKYTQDVKAVGLCGATDWRMPTRKELVSIVDFGRVNPSIDPTYFPNTPASNVWSGSPNAYYASYAWGVNFYFGHSYGYGYRNYNFGVRLVRGGQ